MRKERMSSPSRTTKISYDSVAKSLYIKISRNKVFTTKEISPSFIVDIDRKGQIVGVEILNTTQKTKQSSIKSWLDFSEAKLLVK